MALSNIGDPCTLFGVPSGGHLPDRSTGRIVQGYHVLLLSKAEAKARRPRSSKPHRVYVVCHTCGGHVPFGRLVQHEKACR